MWWWFWRHSQTSAPATVHSERLGDVIVSWRKKPRAHLTWVPRMHEQPSECPDFTLPNDRWVRWYRHSVPRGTTPEKQHKNKLNSKSIPLFHNPADGIAEASRPRVPEGIDTGSNARCRRSVPNEALKPNARIRPSTRDTYAWYRKSVPSGASASRQSTRHGIAGASRCRQKWRSNLVQRTE